MAVSCLITGGDPNHKSLDDTPSGVALPNSTGGTEICTAEPTALPKAILGKVAPGTRQFGYLGAYVRLFGGGSLRYAISLQHI